MPLPNRVKNPIAFKMLPSKKETFRTKGIAKGVTEKKNEAISLSVLADTLRDQLREAV